MILSELGCSIPAFFPLASADVARQERIFMDLGTVDEQMAIRAQRALLRRLTHRSELRLQGDQAHKPACAGGVPASHALSVSFSCLCWCSFSETLPHGTAARLPGTTLDEEELDDDDEEEECTAAPCRGGHHRRRCGLCSRRDTRARGACDTHDRQEG